MGSAGSVASDEASFGDHTNERDDWTAPPPPPPPREASYIDEETQRNRKNVSNTGNDNNADNGNVGFCTGGNGDDDNAMEGGIKPTSVFRRDGGVGALPAEDGTPHGKPRMDDNATGSSGGGTSAVTAAMRGGDGDPRSSSPSSSSSPSPSSISLSLYSSSSSSPSSLSLSASSLQQLSLERKIIAQQQQQSIAEVAGRNHGESCGGDGSVGGGDDEMPLDNATSIVAAVRDGGDGSGVGSGGLGEGGSNVKVAAKIRMVPGVGLTIWKRLADPPPSVSQQLRPTEDCDYGLEQQQQQQRFIGVHCGAHGGSEAGRVGRTTPSGQQRQQPRPQQQQQQQLDKENPASGLNDKQQRHTDGRHQGCNDNKNKDATSSKNESGEAAAGSYESSKKRRLSALGLVEDHTPSEACKVGKQGQGVSLDNSGGPGTRVGCERVGKRRLNEEGSFQQGHQV